MNGTVPSTNQDEIRAELARLRTDRGYLRLRAITLREFRRANDEWRTAKPEELPKLQARAIALLEELERPDALYRAANGEGRLFPHAAESNPESE